MKTEPTTAAVAHTPGPWAILRDCQRERSNPFDAARFIATANAEWSGDSNAGDDYLMSGSLICSTRDSENQVANARLIASAPELLAALNAAESLLSNITQLSQPNHGVMIGDLVRCASVAAEQARAAIAKATSQA